MHLTINQALNLWDELVQCYLGTNKFGGDMCEIYLFSMMEHSQVFAQNADSMFCVEEVDMAKAAIKQLIHRFEKRYHCQVTDDDYDLPEFANNHYYHLKVVKLKKKK